MNKPTPYSEARHTGTFSVYETVRFNFKLAGSRIRTEGPLKNASVRTAKDFLSALQNGLGQ